MAQPYELLARALSTLSTEEQGDVLRALLAGSSSTPSWLGGRTAALARVRLGSINTAALASGVPQLFDQPGGEQTSFLVRLPATLHAELKTWSEQHGHSMNTVVRGLLERFLESQRGLPSSET